MNKIYKIGIIILTIFLVLWGGYFVYSNIAPPSGVEQTIAPSSGVYPWDASKSRNAMEDAVDSQQTSTSNSESDTSSRMVIKTGSLSMIVENVMDSAKKVVEYAKNKNGWVVNSNINEDKQVPSGQITIRVPSESFDESMGYLRILAKEIKYETTQGEDITEQYTDLKSRLRNLEATEQELLKIMQRSGEIADVLAVQRELNTVRGEIEQTKGRMQYFEQSVEMASITVNLALSDELLPIPPSKKWQPIYVLKQAWRSLQNTLRNISYFLIWIVVYLIILLPLAVIVWLVWKIIRRKLPTA